MKKAFVFLLVVSISFALQLAGVRFEGLKNISEDQAFSILGSWKGEASVSWINELKERLLRSGYFSEVSARVDLDEKGNVIVIFHVKENPVLKEWKLDIDGPGLIEDVSSEVTLKEGTILNLNDLRKSIQNIVSAYREAGYPFVEVFPEIGEGTLTIHVVEYGVWDIVFEGADELDATSLKKELNFQTLKEYYEKPVLIRLFIDKKNSYPKISDIQRMVQTLQNKVYFESVNLKLEKVKPEGVKDKVVNLVFDLKLKRLFEGKRKLKLRIVGNTLIPEKEIRDAVGWKGEKELTSFEVLKKAQKVIDLYEKKGYMMSWVDVKVEKDEAIFDVKEKWVKKIDIVYKLGELECKATGECPFRRTRKILVEDLLKIKEGDPLERSAIYGSYAALSRSNYFEKVDILPISSKDSTSVDLKIVLHEKEKKFQFMGGAGWGPPGEGREWWEGIMGQLQLSTVNPLGMGQSVSVSLNLSLSKKSVSLSYSVPRPLDAPITIGAGFGYDLTTDATSSTSTLFGSFTISTRPILDNVFSVGIKNEYDFKENAVTLSISHDYDTRNAAFLPTKGFRTKEIAVFGKMLTEDSYMKVMQSGEVNFELLWNFHLSLREFCGKTIWGDSDITPLPKDSVRGIDISGREVVRGAAEIRYRIDEGFPTDILVFLDAGMAESFVWSAGVGLDVAVPIFGEIEIGYAYTSTEGFKLYFVPGMDLPWISTRGTVSAP